MFLQQLFIGCQRIKIQITEQCRRIFFAIGLPTRFFEKLFQRFSQVTIANERLEHVLRGPCSLKKNKIK